MTKPKDSKSGAHQNAQANPKTKPAEDEPGIANREKDPSDWVTGDEPMTGAQASYLKTLSEEANKTFDETLSKADASRQIEQLRKKAGL